ncbi:hypothetical protein ACJX0J_017021, partial [Zea mays]
SHAHAEFGLNPFGLKRKNEIYQTYGVPFDEDISDDEEEISDDEDDFMYIVTIYHAMLSFLDLRGHAKYSQAPFGESVFYK